MYFLTAEDPGLKTTYDEVTTTNYGCSHQKYINISENTCESQSVREYVTRIVLE
jgi:hypothetical protein